MAYRADATDTGRDDGHLKVHASFGELFKAPELVNVHVAPLNLAEVIQVYGDPRVSLDAGNRVNDQLATHATLSCPRF